MGAKGLLDDDSGETHPQVDRLAAAPPPNDFTTPRVAFADLTKMRRMGRWSLDLAISPHPITDELPVVPGLPLLRSDPSVTIFLLDTVRLFRAICSSVICVTWEGGGGRWR